MNGTVKEGLLRGLSAILASLFTLMLCLTATAEQNEGSINRELNTTSYVLQNNGDGNADTAYFKSEFTSIADLETAKHELAVSIAAEGCVLLKNNNNALPLTVDSEKVTVWGLNSLFPTLGGLVGSSVDATAESGQYVTGFMDALVMKNVDLNNTMTEFYGQDQFFEKVRKSFFFGAEIPGHSLAANFSATYTPGDAFMIGELTASDYTADVLASADGTTALVFLTRDSTEATDYDPNMTDPSGDTYTTPLALSANERQLIELAKEHSNGKVIVILNTDATMEVEELKQDQDIEAILWTGLPGMYGFEGVADVLVGNQSPSGRMVDTYAVNSQSAPAMVNFGIYTYENYSQTADSPLTDTNKGDWYLVENEGIYLGYKYYETRYEDSILGQGQADSSAGCSTGSSWSYDKEVSYPFGYGMSYTTFTQELQGVDVQIGGTSTAKVKVTNTGSVAGKEVVQLYVQVPYTAGGLEKSAIQLMSFAKTEELQPGQSVEIAIEFDAQYMASYDETLIKADGTAGAWVLDEGEYLFVVGNGAHNALNNVLAYKLGSADRLISINDDEIINPENVVAVSVAKDVETYSVNVQNALQDADLNTFISGSVEYFTRTDWTKGWTPVSGISATEEMLVGLQNRSHTLTENNDVEITWGADNGLTLSSMMQFDDSGNFTGTVDIDDPLWDQLLDQVTLDEAIQFLENGTEEYDAIPSIGISNVYINDGPLGYVKDQVSGYAAKWDTSMSNEPTYTSPNDDYADWTMAEMPTEPVVAATFNQELVEREGELLGEDGLWANISGIMGPGVNLHRNTYCARAHEYYSEDAMLTNLMASAFCTGTGHKGTFAAIKHFAMNHMETNRYGVSTFFSEQGARENELRAFQGAAQSKVASGLMTAFNRIGTVYAGGHEGLLKQILRDEWGYEGWVVSDANNGADYMNWLDNIYSGGGCCLSTSQTFSDAEIGSMGDSKNRDKVLGDSLFQQEMKQALKYFMYTFANSNAMNGMSSSVEVARVSPWWEKTIIGVDIGLGVLTAACLIGYAVTALKGKKEQMQSYKEART